MDEDKMIAIVKRLFKKFVGNHSEASEQSQSRQQDSSRETPQPNQSGLAESKIYHKAIEELSKRGSGTLFVNLKHVEDFDASLSHFIQEYFYILYPHLCQAVHEYVAELQQSVVLPKCFERKELFFVGFFNVPVVKSLREVKSEDVGKLIQINCRVSQVGPSTAELIRGCFICPFCLTEHKLEQDGEYMEPSICDQCPFFSINRLHSDGRKVNRTKFHLDLDKSYFCDHQRITVQESFIARGHDPRSFTVVIRGQDQMNVLIPGRDYQLTGSLEVRPNLDADNSNFTLTLETKHMSGNMMRRNLNYKFVFVAYACKTDSQKMPSSEKEEASIGEAYRLGEFTTEDESKFKRMSEDPNLLDNISNSMFSAIYGWNNVKRALVLQIFGGVQKITKTGSRLRGDINVLLIGDPSSGKSALLRKVADDCPVNVVYLSGKGSTTVGLTAGMKRDDAGRMCVQAGALSLASGGICCIDEFDKLDHKCRTAIHEVMEQQTISISKAGLCANLEAATAVLAAGNPIGGVYNKLIKFRDNVNITLPLLSRFDLVFVMVDEHTTEFDRLIAKQVVDMHMSLGDPKLYPRIVVYSAEDIRSYVKYARMKSPKLSDDSAGLIVKKYVKMRKEAERTRNHSSCTVRQLEAIIRLSEAVARLYLKPEVTYEHVEAACKLICDSMSIVDEKYYTILDTQEANVQGSDTQPQGSSGEGSSRTTRIESSRFERIRSELIERVREESEKEDKPGLKRSELIDWYLSKITHEGIDQSYLDEQKSLCVKIIDRLINDEYILIELMNSDTIRVPSLDSANDSVDGMLIVNE